MLPMHDIIIFHIVDETGFRRHGVALRFQFPH